MPDRPTAEAQVRKRQQRKACDVCRRRKSRCDVTDGGSSACSVCVRLKVACRSTADWDAVRAKRKAGCSANDLDGARSKQEPDRIEVASPQRSRDGEETTAGSTARRRVSVVSDKWSYLGSLARTGLAQFFQYGIGSVEWLVFDVYERFRVAYIGTAVSNLAQLTSFRQASAKHLHYPHPAIRPPLSWKPEDGIWGLKGNLDIANDISCFPARDIRHSLVDAYFSRINPGFPVINESQFRAQYADGHHPPPLLLFQAVLFAGAHVCEHPQIASSRAVVKGILFRRASMLFHIRHECNRLHLMQAALLFSWHLDDADTVSSGSYYWLGVAFRIGFGMGVHRDLSTSAVSRLPSADRTMYRRCFWTAFCFEILCALEHGRPCMVSLDDLDQPPLRAEDMIEDAHGTVNDKIQLDYLVRNVALCCIALDILKLNAPSVPARHRPDLVSIDARLALWAMGLEHETDSFWTVQLRLHYNLIRLHLHRNMATAAVTATTMTTAATTETTTTKATAMATATDIAPPPSQASQATCNDAAHGIVCCLEDMVSGGSAGQCHFTAPAAITAAGIQLATEIRAGLGTGPCQASAHALDQMSRLLRCARELALFWPSAEAAHRVLDAIYRDLETAISTGVPDQDRDAAPANTTPISAASPDWRATLLSMECAGPDSHLGGRSSGTA